VYARSPTLAPSASASPDHHVGPAGNIVPVMMPAAQALVSADGPLTLP